ncbi:hypothetical protein [Nocardia arthritidis]|uniref:Uncharacterized protein n=1 Tax=Nocardia arthritidis TaxID=228602 RepID=A0A6G9YC39_9NOCA|nr:hypothetical protein [Nocardia arthritidis]QIS10626.1 hypothetical protein F5544_13690 [Nocardia arthritidis]
MSEVDEINRETLRFGERVAGAWWQLRQSLANRESRQAQYRQLILVQARQLRRVTADRDQALIDLAAATKQLTEVTRERDQLAHELEGARAELDNDHQIGAVDTTWEREYEEITEFQNAQYTPEYEHDIPMDEVVEDEQQEVFESDWQVTETENIETPKPPTMEAGS